MRNPRVVPLSYDQAMADILEAEGVPHRLDVYPGLTHQTLPFNADMLRKTREWFDAHRSAPTSPQPFLAGPTTIEVLSLSAGSSGLALRHALPAGMPGILTLSDLSGRVLDRYPIRGEGTVVWRDPAMVAGAKGLLAVSLRCGNRVVSRLVPMP